MRKIAILFIGIFLVNSFVCAENLEDHFKRVNDFFSQEKYTEALIECQKIVKIAPDTARSYGYLGYCYYMLCDYKKAVEIYTKALSLDPKNAFGYAYLAGAYNGIKEYRLAIAKSKHSIKLNPSNYFSYFTLGYAYFNIKKYNQAIESFEKSISLKSDYVDAWYYLGRSLLSKKKYKEARNKFLGLINRFSNSRYIPAAKCSIGDTYFGENKFSLAIDAYNNVIKNYPNYIGLDYAKFGLAKTYFKKKEYKDVIVILREFLNEYPQSKFNKKVRSLLVISYSKEGMVDESMKELKKSGIVNVFTVSIVIGIFLLIIVLFVLGVYVFGKVSKRKIKEDSSGIFKIRDVILIAAVTITLPSILSPIVAKLIYGQYLIGLFVQAKSIESVYSMIISLIISNILLAVLILRFLFKKCELDKETLGLVFKDLKSITILPLLAVFILGLFTTAYGYIVKNILHLNIPANFFSTIVGSIKTPVQGLTLFIAIVLIVPIAEEIIFRIFFYGAFKRYIGIKWGIFFSGLFFAIYHFDPWYLLPLCFVGAVLAYIYEKTKSIIPCMIVHSLNNFIFFVFMYFFSDIKI